MARRAPTLPDSELDVLSVLWEKKTGTVREILASLQKRGRTWSYATVATLLDRLERKKFITSNRDELAYVYSALIEPEHVRNKRLGSVIEKLFDNDPSELITHVIETYRMETKEVEKIKAALEKGQRRRPRGSEPAEKVTAKAPKAAAKAPKAAAKAKAKGKK
jgi:predicted transcriptional regulator